MRKEETDDLLHAACRMDRTQLLREKLPNNLSKGGKQHEKAQAKTNELDPATDRPLGEMT